MVRKTFVRLFILVIAPLILYALPVSGAPRALDAARQQLTCQELVTLATTVVGEACNDLGRNQACYGSQQVRVEFIPDQPPVFNATGDRVDLLTIRALSTSPFDQANNTWGMAFLKAQANLPDALPGQNVTFLLFGDATLENVTADMRAVRLSSGITGTECEEAPSGVLIQSPSGQQVTMNINGADITLGSTIFMSALPSVSMKLSTIEGLAVVSSFGETRIVPEGGEIGVALGGEDGLEVAGAPSALRGFTQVQLPFVPLGLLDGEIELPESLNIVGAMPAVTASPTPATDAATSVPSGCVRRADWTNRYVVQPGDTLSSIASRAGVRLEDFAAGNCIVDVSRLRAGETLNSPVFIPTVRPPTVLPTVTVTPTASYTIIGPNLRADANPIYLGSCTFIRWDVANINQVYFEGGPAVGSEARQVCPRLTTTYTLRVLRLDGVTQDFPITIFVETTCGNQICEPGETAQTCPSDCYIG